MKVTVIGLGPAGPGLITAEALAAIDAVPVRWLRTSQHPSASAVPGARSFDYLYEASPTLAQVYAAIVEALVEEAGAAPGGHVLYAVPGSPLIAERSVELLRADPRLSVTVLPGLSFTDLAFARLSVDPLAVGARIVDGHRFQVEAAGYQGAMLVGQCDSKAVLSEVKTAIGQGELVVLQRLGLPDEKVTTVAWDDLDRSIEPDHLTSVWAPRLAVSVAPEMAQLEELARELRAKCPWDRQQTHQSLTRYLVEETYEVLEAIEELGEPNGYEHLEEELGDLLFQVFFHSVLAGEEGQFTVGDVARTVHDKLVARHPHVFADVVAETPGDVARNWEQIKRAEKKREGALDGVPGNLPALMLSHKLQSRAATVGFDWPDVEGPLAKVAEELAELAEAPDTESRREELGDLLFSVVNVARHMQLDPEEALRGAAKKFRQRFEAMETLAREQGLDLASLGLEALDDLWGQVK